MNDLSDDERNLLRYYAEQSASSMGWCECPSPAPAVRLRRAT